MRRILLPLIIYALLALVALLLLHERENTLVTRSRRLLTTQYPLEHEWLDQDHILYREYRDPREFRVLDVNTRKVTAVPFADAKLKAAQRLMGLAFPLPDGRSFVTFISYGSGDAVWVPLKADAAQQAKRLKGWPEGRVLGWLDGGKSFLMDVSEYPGGFGGQPPIQYRRYSWPDWTRIEPPTIVEPLAPEEAGPDLSWYPSGLSGGKVHLYSVWGKDTYLVEIDYSSGKALSTRILLPVDRPVFQAVLSPDGRKLLWTMSKDPGTTVSHMRFWLSSVDGTGFREVAHTGEAPKLSYTRGGDVPDVKWRPDSSAVTIHYQSGVFLLPVR